MKTRIIQPTEQKPEQPIKYPCLMKSESGAIVYATDPQGGACLINDSGLSGKTAYASEDPGSVSWTDSGYTPMRGKVAIEFDMEDNQ